MESLLLLSQKAQLTNILHQKRNALRPAAQTAPLSAEDEAIARECNAADLELYAYAADLFEERIREEGKPFQEKLKKFMFINKKFQNISSLLYKKVHDGQGQNAAIELAKDIQW